MMTTRKGSCVAWLGLVSVTVAAAMAVVMTVAMTASMASAADETSVSEDATELAGRVVQSDLLAEAVRESLRLQLPPGSATEFGLVLAQQHQPLWNALETELAARLEERLAPDELRGALARFDESPDAVWREHGEIFLALAQDEPGNPAESRRQLRILGCVASAFGPNIDATREVRAQAGRELEIDEGLLQNNADAVAAFTETCTCVMDGIYEQFQSEMIHGEQSTITEEQMTYGQELVESGACPSPLGSSDG